MGKVTGGQLRSFRSTLVLWDHCRSQTESWGHRRAAEVPRGRLRSHEVGLLRYREVCWSHKGSQKVGWGHMKSNYLRMLLAAFKIFALAAYLAGYSARIPTYNGLHQKHGISLCILSVIGSVVVRSLKFKILNNNLIN